MCRIAVFLTASLLAAIAGSPTSAQPPAPAAPEPAKAPEGILPLPDFSGDLSSRRYFTGDWGGTRNDLAAKGFTFDIDWTQTVQGVVSGGNRIDWDYGGSLDYVANFDLMRMGVLPGAVLKLRAESRYGESVNDDSGAFLPVNTDSFFPLAGGGINEGIPITVTELTYTQFLSEKFALLIGKLQTLDGDANEFAGGRGRHQFMNSNFVFNAVSSRTTPYSALGAAVVVAPTDKITITSTLINTTDSSTTSGFDHVEDGWTWATEAGFQYRLGGLPGGSNAGFMYAFANNFAQLGGKLRPVPGLGLQPDRESTSWAVYLSTWQYLYAPEAGTAPAKINTTDGEPDLKGIGLFGRFGFADEDTNPVNWSASGGVCGRGLIPGRDFDSYGLGYFYSDFQNGRGFAALNLQSSAQGVEAFYNLAIMRAARLTFDAQWVDGGFESTDPATVVGVRLNVRF